MSGASTYYGATIVSQGTLIDSGDLPALTDITIASGATFQVNTASDYISSVSGAGTLDILTGKNLYVTTSESKIFSGAMIGAGGSFSKNGSGVLTLTGTNNFSGTININAGSLSLGGDQATLGDMSKVNVGAAGTIDFSANGAAIGSLAGDAGARVLLGTAALTTGNNAAVPTVFAGIISGPGGLTKTGTGNFTLSGSNTFSGPLNVEGGRLITGNTLNDIVPVTVGPNATLQIGGISGFSATETIGSLTGSGTVALYSGSTLAVGSIPGSTVFSGAINQSSGTGGKLVKMGIGTLTLTGSSSYSGATTVSEGALVFSGVNGSAASSTGAATVYYDSALILDNSAGNNNNRWAGTVTLNGGSFELKGNGATAETIGALSSAKSANTVKVSGTGALTVASITVASGSTLNFQGIDADNSVAVTSYPTSPVLTPTGSGILAYATVNRTDFATVDSYKKVIAYTSYTDDTFPADDSTKVMRMTQSNTDLNDPYTINSLKIAGDYNLGGTGALTLYYGGLITTGTTTISKPLIASGRELDAFINGETNITAAVTASSGFVKSGTGTLTFSSNGSMSAAAYINEGILRYGKDNVIGTNVYVNGGTLDLATYNDAVSSVNLYNGEITGSGTLTGTGYYMYDGTVSAKLGGAVALTKDNDGRGTGGGTVTLSNQNSYTGLTTVTYGTLAFGADGVLPNTNDVTVSSSGVLDIGGFTNVIDILTLNSGKIVGGGTVAANTFTAAGGTVAANIAPNTMNTTGTLLVDSLINAGTINVNSGTLKLNADNLIGADTTVNVAASAVLDMNNVSDAIGALSLSGSGTVKNVATLTTGNNNASTTLNGSVLSGTAATPELVKVGDGTTTLGTTSNIDTNVTVAGGTVASSKTNAINAARELQINNNGTFSLLNGSSQTVAGLDVGTGGNLDLGTGTFTVNGDGTVSGTVDSASGGTLATAGAGTVTVGATASLADALDVQVGSGSTLVFNNTDTIHNLAVSGGSVGGTGNITCSTVSVTGISPVVSANLTVAGDFDIDVGAGGTATLSGTNQIGGSVNLNSGTTVASAASLGNVNNTAALVLNGGTYTHAISGIGTVTVASNVTFTEDQPDIGPTSVQGTANILGAFGGQMTVAEGAWIKGFGPIAYADVDGGVSPGASPGTISIGTLIWEPGSQYEWEIDMLEGDGGVAGSDPGWDLIDVTGDMTINAPVTINLTTLSHDTHAIAPLSNFDKTQDYSWLITQVAGTINFSEPNWWSLNTANFENVFSGGHFALRVEGGKQLWIDYTGAGGGDVPEPSTLLLLLPFIGFGLKKMRGKKV